MPSQFIFSAYMCALNVFLPIFKANMKVCYDLKKYYRHFKRDEDLNKVKFCLEKPKWLFYGV